MNKNRVNWAKASLSILALAALMIFGGCGKSTTIDAGVTINGVKWATRNVDDPGHFAATPESYGKFYQWNRAKAWDATGDVTGWDDTDPTGDAWVAANDPSPAGWRVPTTEEQQKLLDETKVENEWVTEPVAGQLFTDKATGASLFLPAAGYRLTFDGTLFYAGMLGNYWSSTVYGTYTACYLKFYNGWLGGTYWDNDYRAFGFSVRCVAE